MNTAFGDRPCSREWAFLNLALNRVIAIAGAAEAFYVYARDLRLGDRGHSQGGENSGEAELHI